MGSRGIGSGLTIFGNRKIFDDGRKILDLWNGGCSGSNDWLRLRRWRLFLFCLPLMVRVSVIYVPLFLHGMRDTVLFGMWDSIEESLGRV